MKKRYYIAYGSNLNIEQMALRCPDAKPVGYTELQDFRLVFQGRRTNAHANVIPSKGDKVPAVVWEISKRDEAALDIYEGVRGGYYYKDYFPVRIGDQVHDALIYIMTPNGYGIPSDIYLHTIVEGYHTFDIDIRYLNDAVLDARHKAYQIAASM